MGKGVRLIKQISDRMRELDTKYLGCNGKGYVIISSAIILS